MYLIFVNRLCFNWFRILRLSWHVKLYYIHRFFFKTKWFFKQNARNRKSNNQNSLTALNDFFYTFFLLSALENSTNDKKLINARSVLVIFYYRLYLGWLNTLQYHLFTLFSLDITTKIIIIEKISLSELCVASVPIDKRKNTGTHWKSTLVCRMISTIFFCCRSLVWGTSECAQYFGHRGWAFWVKNGWWKSLKEFHNGNFLKNEVERRMFSSF